MLMIALRSIYGDYGRVRTGQRFECPLNIAEKLMARGLVKPYIEATVAAPPENKALAPPENKAEPKAEPPAEAKHRGRPRKSQ